MARTAGGPALRTRSKVQHHRDRREPVAHADSEDRLDSQDHALDQAGDRGATPTSYRTDIIGIDRLPVEVLANIFRRTLDPAHPGSVLCRSFRAPHSFDAFNECKTDFTRSETALLAEHFSLESLRHTSDKGPLPAIVVCKLWHRAVMEGDVVRCVATGAPTRLPPSLRTLLLNVETPVRWTDSRLQPFSKAISESGLPRLEKVVLGLECTASASPEDGPTGDHNVAAVFPLLPSLSSLVELQVHCDLTETGHDIAPHLAKLTQLRLLNLGACNLEDDVRALAPSLRLLTGLTGLDLSLNGLGEGGGGGSEDSLDDADNEDDNMQVLLRHITVLTGLRALSLTDNSVDNVSETTLRGLAEYIAGLTLLEELHLEDMGACEGFFDALVPRLTALSGLAVINLSTNVTENDVMARLAGLLTKFTGLQKLYLSDISSVHSFAIAWADCLTMTTLQTLDLSRSAYIEDEGAQELASRFATLPMLHALDLTCSGLGGELLAKSLSSLRSLAELRLRESCLQDDGARFIATGITALSGLRSIDLGNNAIGDAGCMELSQAMCRLGSLEVVALNHNCITAEGARDLAACLEVLPAITHLDLAANELGDQGAEIVAVVLVQRTNLDTLRLTYCAVGSRCAKRVKKLFAVAGRSEALWINTDRGLPP